MKTLPAICLAAVALFARWPASAQTPPADPPPGFRHAGDYLVTSRLKVTDAKVTRVTIKPFRIRVFTNGSEVQVASSENQDSGSSFQVYRSDGIGRQASRSAALEIVPGLQASSDQGGVLTHLRLSPECLTITRFPGVSNQTIITHAVAAQTPASVQPASPKPPSAQHASVQPAEPPRP
jgi:hypothetical protein